MVAITKRRMRCEPDHDVLNPKDEVGAPDTQVGLQSLTARRRKSVRSISGRNAAYLDPNDVSGALCGVNGCNGAHEKPLRQAIQHLVLACPHLLQRGAQLALNPGES
jgi:hypothetical protein